MKDSVVYLLYKLLRKNKIAIDEEEVKFQLLSHPTYPSLHSITGVLDHFSIENVAARVPVDSETLSQLDSYFLTQIKNDTGEHFVILIKKNNEIKLVFGREYTQTLSEKEFMHIWTGVILLIDPSENTKIDTSGKQSWYHGVTSFFLGTILVVAFLLLKPELTTFIHYLLSFTGLLFSALIISKELGIQSNAVHKICNKEQKNIDCDAVLNSKGATLFNKLKLSNVSIVYFGTLILSSLLILLNNGSNDFIYLISIVAIPFTLYSIFYQYKIVKNWCVLCLCITLVLWLQAITIYFTNFDIKELTFDGFSFGFVLICSVVISTAWSYIIPLLKNEMESRKLKIKHYKFKRNYSVFNHLLSESNHVPHHMITQDEILFGDKSQKPKLGIIIITNPSCGHCKNAHELVEKLIDLNNDQIQIIIRFNVPAHLKENSGTRAAARLTELSFSKDQKIVLEAMHEAYSDTPIELWENKWGNSTSEKASEILKTQERWCVENNKNFTPEILINGKSFPKEYNTKELLFFVEDLLE